MNQRLTDALAGGAAGLAGGLFGGGGGMVLLPILSHQGHLEGRQVYATCIGVIFPACVISAVVYLLRGGVALSVAAPYLAGGLVGGWLGARLYGHIPLGVLRWLAAGVLLYGGVRYLL